MDDSADSAVPTGVLEPHPWLGLDYRDLLPGLLSGEHRFTLSLTRPNGFSHGAGALRVVAVRAGQDKPHCILAYEGYTATRSRGNPAAPASGAADQPQVSVDEQADG